MPHHETEVLHLTGKLTRAQFERLIGENRFDSGKRYDLVKGEVVVVPPEGPLHFGILNDLAYLLEECFGPGFVIRRSGELDIAPDENEGNPAPDIAVVAGGPLDRRYRAQHPRTALLVVEVSHTTLGRDRSHKLSMYARASIQEYWIVNVVDRSIEIHTKPVSSSRGQFGWIYDQLAVVRSGTVRPLAAAGEPIPLDAIF